MTSDIGRPAAGEQSATQEQNPALVRFLKIAVIGMGILILAGLTAVIWRIVNLASSPKDAPPAVTSAAPLSAAPSAALPPEAMLALPDGATVRSVALSANRLAVHYWAPSGSGIAIMDLESGRILTRVRLGTSGP